MKKLLLTGYVALAITVFTANSGYAQCLADSICPQITTNSGSVRGYYFTAPCSFTICGLYIPTDASTGDQSIEVVRFIDSLPPAYPKLTNKFISLFYTASNTSTTMIPCSISINAGDTIGVYGARSTSTICSYAMPLCSTSIFGNPVTLSRSGMQFPLYNQQMHDIWSEISADISRVIMYVSAPLSVPESMMDPSLIRVYPNPSSGQFTLDSKISNGEISVYNIVGEKVYSSSLTSAASSAPSDINLSAQPNGIYFFRMKTAQGTVNKKIIINK